MTLFLNAYKEKQRMVLFCLPFKFRHLRSCCWWLSWLGELVSVESIFGKPFPALLKGFTILSAYWKYIYIYIYVMQPNLSASWLFQRAMSAKKESKVSRDFINELLYVNFHCMKVRFLFLFLLLFLLPGIFVLHGIIFNPIRN